LPQLTVSGLALASDRDSDNPLLEGGRVETWTASANASQLLFGSGRVLASTRAARAQIRGAVADYDFALQTLLLDVTRAYADVRQAQAVVTARETTVTNLSRLLEYARAQFDAGFVTRTDVAQSQARLAQARTQLVQAQGAMAAAVQAYQRLVGRPPAGLEAPASVEGLPAALESALESAGRTSPVLRGAIADSELADANVAVAAASGRLRMSLEAGLAQAAEFDNDFSESSTDTVGVRVSAPLLQGGAAARS
jgi:outer membrane protein